MKLQNNTKEQQQMKDISEDKKDLTAKMLAAGLTESEAKQINENLEALSMHLTILDKALKSLPVQILSSFRDIGVKAVEQGKLPSRQMDLQEKLGVLVEMAKQYQGQFGTTEDNLPAVNTFTGMAVAA